MVANLLASLLLLTTFILYQVVRIITMIKLLAHVPINRILHINNSNCLYQYYNLN